MQNPNQNPVLSFVEKRAAHPSEMLYYPAVVQSYDEYEDTFTICADERYVEEGRDTDYFDFDDTTIPAFLIHVVTGADSDYDEPSDWVGHKFLIPGCPVNAV